jgi:hypothetical protein
LLLLETGGNLPSPPARRCVRVLLRNEMAGTKLHRLERAVSVRARRPAPAFTREPDESFRAEGSRGLIGEIVWRDVARAVQYANHLNGIRCRHVEQDIIPNSKAADIAPKLGTLTSCERIRRQSLDRTVKAMKKRRRCCFVVCRDVLPDIQYVLPGLRPQEAAIFHQPLSGVSPLRSGLQGPKLRWDHCQAHPGRRYVTLPASPCAAPPFLPPAATFAHDFACSRIAVAFGRDTTGPLTFLAHNTIRSLEIVETSE